MLLLMAAAIGAGFMSIDSDRPGAWRILDGEATQNVMALDLAREVAASEGVVLSPGAGGRKLSTQGPGGVLAELAHRAPLDIKRFVDAGVASGRRLNSTEAASQQTSDDERVSLFLFYKSDIAGAETVFTPKRLQEMCLLEQHWLRSVDALRIDRFDSVVALFYGEGPDPIRRAMPLDGSVACAELPEASVSGTVAAIQENVRALGARSPYGRFIHPDFASTGRSITTRSHILLRAEEDKQDQVATVVMDYLGRQNGFFQDGLFHSSAFIGEEDRFVQKGAIRVRVVSDATNEFKTMVQLDFMLAILSVFIVWVVMWLHLNSFFASSMGMFQILASLPIGALIYKSLQIDYFEFLHVLVIYLVLGIGADDAFVLFDMFRHIGHSTAPLAKDGRYPKDVLVDVLQQTIGRSAGSIFNTSFTTAMAFLSCSGSKAMPMRTCGWYAAIAIILNFIFTMIFLPSVLVIWHMYLEGSRCCCPVPRLRPEGTVAEPGGSCVGQRVTLVDLFLDRLYIPAMNKRVGRFRPVPIVLVLGMLVVAFQGVYFAAQLTPPRSAEVWFPESHMLMEVSEFMASSFNTPAHDGYTVLDFAWGIDRLDVSDIDVYHPSRTNGKLIFDQRFDLSTEEAQRFVLDTCEKMKTLSCDLEGCDNTGYGTLMLQTDSLSDSCFLRDFKAWNNGTLPTGADFLPLLKVFRDSADARDYTGEVLRQDVDYKKDIGIIDGELRYVVVKIRSTMSKMTPFSRGTDVQRLLAKFVEERQDNAPESMKSLRFVGGGIFARFDLSRELLSGLFSGCAIAMPIAFLVLLASTWNIVIASYAVFSVGSIVLCVLGFCKGAMNWDLGVGEAIAGVIVIGYSVDYVVHLAHIYCEAKHSGHQTREGRAEFAVRNMGSTVVAGAVTTAVSGAAMFLCFVYFFVKMAVLICVTIMYSFLFSLVFFMPLLWWIGPEGDFGNLTAPRCLAGGTRVMPVAKDWAPPTGVLPQPAPPDTQGAPPRLLDVGS